MGVLNQEGLSQEALAVGLSLCGQGIYEANLRTGEATFSDAWHRLVGIRACDRPQSIEAWQALIHPADLNVLQAELQAFLSEPAGSFEYKYRLRKPEGGDQWLQGLGQVVEFCEDGQPLRWVGIDKKLDSKPSVPDADSLSQQTLDSAGIGIMLVKQDGTLAYANEALAAWLKVTPEQLRQLRLDDFLSGYRDYDISESWNHLWNTAANNPLPTNARRSLEAQLKPIAGDPIDVSVCISFIEHRNSRLACLAVSDLSEQHAKLKRYQQDESTTRRLLDTLPAYIWQKDTHNRILRVNRTAAQASGREPEEIEGRSAEEVYPDQAEGYYKVDREVIKSGKAVRGVIEQLDDGNGGIRWISVDKLPVKNSNGQVEGVLVACTDITELKSSQEQLEISERRFRSLAQNIGQVLWIRSPDGSVTHYVSPAFERVWQIDSAEVMETPHAWLSLCSPEDRQRIEAAYAAKACLGSYDEVYRIVRPDGTARWIRDRGFPIHDASGKITQITGFAIDISDEREKALTTERNLSKSQSFFRTLKKSFSETSLPKLARLVTEEIRMLIDADLVTLRLEPTSTGSDPLTAHSEQTHRATNDGFPDLKRVLEGESVRKALADSRHPLRLIANAADNYEAITPQQQSSDDPYLWIGASLLASDCTVLGHIAVAKSTPQGFSDLCAETLQQYAVVLAFAIERQRATRQLLQSKEELEESNRSLDRFTYVASHDLKAPMRAIDNLAAWLSDDIGDSIPEDSARHLATLRKRARRMEKMLDDLLAYSRIGRRSDQATEVDVNQMVRDAFEFVNANERFSLETKELPTLTTATQPLELCFRNLIDNAIKHHDREQGHLTVAAQHQGDHYIFSVTDDGPGIEPTFHHKIFGMFQSLKPRDEVEGSGIGLAMLKRTVEHYGGKLWLDSVPGRGSTFYFSWPKNVRMPQ